jgi:hypothetical protein
MLKMQYINHGQASMAEGPAMTSRIISEQFIFGEDQAVKKKKKGNFTCNECEKPLASSGGCSTYMAETKDVHFRGIYPGYRLPGQTEHKHEDEKNLQGSLHR